MELVDAHCHFDFPVFAGHRQDILDQARQDGVSRIVIPGVRRADWQRVRDVAGKYAGAYYCLGIHPWFIDEHEPSDLDLLREALAERPAGCVAVGECGLDRLRGELTTQTPWFEAQIELAGELGYPLVVHSVRTHDEVHTILRASQFSGRTLIHGFAGSYQQACKLVDIGCYIGVGGIITHERASKTRVTVSRLPLEALVLETDAPDMAPAGVDKGANSPTYLPRIFNALTALRTEPSDTVAMALLANVRALYGWEASDSSFFVDEAAGKG